MKTFLRIGLIAVITSSLTFFLGCSSHDEPIPTQLQVEQSWPMNAATTATIEIGQKWFANASKQTTHNASKQTTHSVEVNWQQAMTAGDYIVAPLIEPSKFFENIPQQGFRFLVIQVQSNSVYTGRIVELLLPSKSHTLEGAMGIVVKEIYSIIDAGLPATRIENFTGSMFIYSPTYKHQIGVLYKDGVLQQGRFRLKAEMKITKAGDSTTTKKQGLPNGKLIAVTTCEVITVSSVTSYGDTYSYTTVDNCYTEYYETGSGGSTGGPTSGWGDSSGGGDTGGSGDGTNGQCRCPGYVAPPPPPPVESLVSIYQLPPCVQTVMQGIVSSGVTLSSKLAPYFGSTLKFYPRMNVVALNNNSNGQRVGGNTARAQDGSFDPTYKLPIYDININSGQLYGDTHGPGATNMGVAATILHELTHAYLIEWNKGQPLDPNASLGTLLQNYTKMVKSSEVEQHALMSQIVDALGQQLFAYCNGAGINTNLTYCTNLMWSGLTTTDKFQVMKPEEQLAIKNTMGMENYNSPVNNGRDADGNTLLLYPTGSKACQ
jgi:hypothetical protein